MQVVVTVDSSLRELFPRLKVGCILSVVSVKASAAGLVDEIDRVVKDIESSYTPGLIREQTVVEITKSAYRKTGQDPNRYRPSAESLLRRVASGKGLNLVNNIVDILNLVSVQSGFSVGGYDADSIKGSISFGIGLPGEPYEGIGRGVLNIGCIPVFRDNLGAFGTPTSDSVRTKVTETTKNFLMLIPVFSEIKSEPESVIKMAVNLLERYGDVMVYETSIIN